MPLYSPHFKLIVARAGARRLTNLGAHLKKFIDRNSSVKAGSGAFATHDAIHFGACRPFAEMSYFGKLGYPAGSGNWTGRLSGKCRCSRLACVCGGGQPTEIAEMLIHDMTRQASIDLLARMPLCRLACAHEGQPYVTPIHCVYHDLSLIHISEPTRLGMISYA